MFVNIHLQSHSSHSASIFFLWLQTNNKFQSKRIAPSNYLLIKYTNWHQNNTIQIEKVVQVCQIHRPLTHQHQHQHQYHHLIHRSNNNLPHHIILANMYSIISIIFFLTFLLGMLKRYNLFIFNINVEHTHSLPLIQLKSTWTFLFIINSNANCVVLSSIFFIEILKSNFNFNFIFIIIIIIIVIEILL